MLAERNSQIRKAVGVLKELSVDKRTRMLFEDRKKARRDEASITRGVIKDTFEAVGCATSKAGIGTGSLSKQLWNRFNCDYYYDGKHFSRVNILADYIGVPYTSFIEPLDQGKPINIVVEELLAIQRIVKKTNMPYEIVEEHVKSNNLKEFYKFTNIDITYKKRRYTLLSDLAAAMEINVYQMLYMMQSHPLKRIVEMYSPVVWKGYSYNTEMDWVEKCGTNSFVDYLNRLSEGMTKEKALFAQKKDKKEFAANTIVNDGKSVYKNEAEFAKSIRIPQTLVKKHIYRNNETYEQIRRRYTCNGFYRGRSWKYWGDVAKYTKTNLAVIMRWLDGGMKPSEVIKQAVDTYELCIKTGMTRATIQKLSKKCTYDHILEMYTMSVVIDGVVCTSFEQASKFLLINKSALSKMLNDGVSWDKIIRDYAIPKYQGISVLDIAKAYKVGKITVLRNKDKMQEFIEDSLFMKHAVRTGFRGLNGNNEIIIREGDASQTVTLPEFLRHISKVI